MLIDLYEYLDDEPRRRIFVDTDQIAAIAEKDEGISLIYFASGCLSFLVYGNPEQIAERVNNIKSRRYR